MSRSPHVSATWIIVSTRVKSNSPSVGSRSCQVTGASTVFAPRAATRWKLERMATSELELELWISAPRTRNGRSSTIRPLSVRRAMRVGGRSVTTELQGIGVTIS
jgi:hypothetical protein